MYELSCPGCPESANEHVPGNPGQTYACPDCGYIWTDSEGPWEEILLTIAVISTTAVAGAAAYYGMGWDRWTVIAALVATLVGIRVLSSALAWVRFRIDPVEVTR